MPIPMTLYNQTVVLQPMKELDAVNTMLLVAGESPVDTLDGEVLNVDAIQARQALSATSRDVQVEGWHFNTEYNVRLLPSPPLPGEVASLVREDVTGSDRGFLSPSRRNTLVGLDVGRLLRRHI